MSKTVFITRKIPEVAIKKLQEKGFEVDVNPNEAIPTQEELITFLKQKSYDAVLTLLTDKIGAEVFDASPSTKLYVNYATGFDNIDLAEAAKRGVSIANAPAQSTSEAVAEHTFALMLALAARIVEADESVRQGKYAGWSPMNFIGMDVLGKTLGIVGAGRIGGKVAHYAKGLGMKVIYTDTSRNEDIEKDVSAIFMESLEELLGEADIVSLHVPLLDSTRHLINKEMLHLMKPAGLLINTSRGPIIDEAALELALASKVIAGAALDVFEMEPQLSPGLVKMQNTIFTPHIASASVKARNEMAEISADNIIDFFDGKTPKYLINQS